MSKSGILQYEYNEQTYYVLGITNSSKPLNTTKNYTRTKCPYMAIEIIFVKKLPNCDKIENNLHAFKQIISLKNY